MKKIMCLAFISIVWSIQTLKAQVNSDIVNLNHSSISDFNVEYTLAQQSTLSITPPQIAVLPKVTVSLRLNANVSRIYFKVLDKDSSNVLYQADYDISSQAVFSNGVKLFENSNGIIFISNGYDTYLKPYIYSIQTEDDQGKLSDVYSTIR